MFELVGITQICCATAIMMMMKRQPKNMLIIATAMSMPAVNKPPIVGPAFLKQTRISAVAAKIKPIARTSINPVAMTLSFFPLVRFCTAALGTKILSSLYVSFSPFNALFLHFFSATKQPCF